MLDLFGVHAAALQPGGCPDFLRLPADLFLAAAGPPLPVQVRPVRRRGPAEAASFLSVGICRADVLDSRIHLDKHSQRYGGRLLGGSSEDLAKRREEADQCKSRIVKASYLVEGLFEGTANLATFYFLKEELSLGPASISFLFGLAASPWALKPGWAVLSDRVELFGAQRTPYLLLGLLVTASSYSGLGLGLAKSYRHVAALLLLSQLGRSMWLAALQGMVAETATREGDSRMVGDMSLVKAAGALCSASLSTVLLARAGPSGVLRLCAGLPLLLLPAVWYYQTAASEAYVHQSPTAEQDQARPLSQDLATLRETCTNPGVWATIGFMFVLSGSPRYNDSLYYFYIDRLQFHPSSIAALNLAGQAAKVFGLLVYRCLLVDTANTSLIVGLAGASCPLCLTPLLLTTGAYKKLGLDPARLAVAIELLRDACFDLQKVAATAQWLRLSPQALAGTFVSMTGTTMQVANALSNFVSATAATGFKVSSNNFDHLSELIVFCTSCAAAAFPLVAFFPQEDGDVAAVVDEEGSSAELGGLKQTQSRQQTQESAGD